MAKGFFHSSTLRSLKSPTNNVPKCGSCGLYKYCQSPKMPYSGQGGLGILIVGEAPGPNDDSNGEHLRGEHGKYVRSVFESFGVDVARDCWMTNAIICHPAKSKPPTNDQIDYCRPNLMKTIKELNPKVIILLGISAIRSVMGDTWDDSNIGSIQRWAGWNIPYQKWNTWICPTFQPAYVMRALTMRRPDRVPELFFKRHIEAAIAHVKRPWKTVPDYKGQVEVITQQNEACKAIEKVIGMEDSLISFDYEANMLKPDNDEFKVYSCSICVDGDWTFAFPWTKATATTMRRLLRSPQGKIASNLKYEDRVSQAVLKTRVRNWHWDTMIAAHVINNERGVTSVKFQAFVLLGFPPYNEHIEPLLRSDESGGYQKNQIEEISLQDLLIYNGVDSLVEYLVYEEQNKLFT